MGTTIPLSREIVGSATQRGLNSVTLGFRPEDVTLTMSEDGIPIEVQIVEELGPDAYIYGTFLSDGDSHQIVARTDGRRHPIQGETVRFKVNGDRALVFVPETGERLV